MDSTSVDLSGLLSFIVLAASASIFVAIGLISFGVAAYKGSPTWSGIKKHGAYGFVAGAFLLLFFNAAASTTVSIVMDNNGPHLEAVDAIVLKVWSWLQFVVWIVFSFSYNWFRR